MIVVFGSLGVDLVTNVAHIPQPGETVLCEGYFIVPGAKGGNQAVAAARAGSKTRFIGSCGTDGFAEQATSIMRAAGVDLSALAHVDKPTAVALITVDVKGENAIVVASGANQSTTAAQLEAAGLGEGDIVLLQNEIPAEASFAAIAYARSRGARTVFNVAPAGPVPVETLRQLDYLVVNELEAIVVAKSAGIESSDPEDAVREISARFGCGAIVTLGPEGAVAWSDGVRRAVPALKVTPVDTTAAGDSFTGAFAAALDQGFGLTMALARGAAGGSLACTRPGSQPSIADKAEIDEALKGYSA